MMFWADKGFIINEISEEEEIVVCRIFVSDSTCVVNALN